MKLRGDAILVMRTIMIYFLIVMMMLPLYNHDCVKNSALVTLFKQLLELAIKRPLPSL